MKTTIITIAGILFFFVAYSQQVSPAAKENLSVRRESMALKPAATVKNVGKKSELRMNNSRTKNSSAKNTVPKQKSSTTPARETLSLQERRK